MSCYGENFGSWFKSSYSSNAHHCVEVALTAEAAAVRDSKNRASEQLIFSTEHWESFLTTLKK